MKEIKAQCMAVRALLAWVLLVTTTVWYWGCQGDVAAPPPQPTNVAPRVAGSIPAQSVSVRESVIVDLATYFSDPDGDPLVYSASSSDSTVATVTVGGSTVGITGIKQGIARVTAIASDPSGLSAQQSFSVTVPNRAPEASGSIPTQILAEGDTATLDMAPYFTDPDGDALTYSVSSSDTAATVASNTGSVLMVVARRWARSTVTVTARDAGGLFAEQEITVVGPNRAPMAVDSIPHIEVDVGGEAVVTVSPFFRDPDGDALVFRAETSNARVAGIAVSSDSVTVAGAQRQSR